MRLKHTLVKLTLAPVLAMALLAGACSEQGGQTSQLMGPEHASFAKGGVRRLQKLDVTNPAPLHATAEFGPSGGVLQAGSYFLAVPGGAVKQKTTFTMDIGTDGVADLTAFATRANGTRVDVGVTGFRKKLTLALYYGNSAEAIADESKLEIGWVQSNGSLSAVSSSVDTQRKLVLGHLSHFSKYAVIIPE